MSCAYESSSRGLYRSRQGIFFGVCRGIADHLNFSVFWTRTLVVIAFIFTGFWPVGALYLLAALLMKREPNCAFEDDYAGATGHFRRTFDNLDQRLQHLEAVVTDRARDWDRRLYNG